MAGGGGGDQGGNEKNTYYILWMMALIILISGVIWYFFDTQLKTVFIAIRKYELMGIYLVVGFLPFAFVNQYIPWFQIPDLSERVAGDLMLVREITPSLLNLEIAGVLSTEVGEFLRVPVAIILVCLAIYIYKNHLLMRFTTKHNTTTLVAQEMSRWPQIRIVSKVDLLEEDLDSGPWSMALTPMQYAKKNKIIRVEKAALIGSGFSKTQAPEYAVTLDRLRAERLFASQLGRAWQGVASMAPYRRAIFSILIGKASRDSKKAQELIYKLADSAGGGQLDLKNADDLWQKHYKSTPIEKIFQQHAYEFTVLASLMLLAREDGVLAAADFLWVKPMDRRLWYVINNVGRQTPAAEVGGIFAHWYNELALKRPLSVPVVEAAVDALQLALSDIIYVPDEKEKEEIQKRHREAQQAPAAPAAESENG